MKKFLITGGQGFIGGNLCNFLSKENEVIIIDDLSNVKKKFVKKNKNVKFIKKKIQNINKFPKIDCIFHLAAQSSVQYSFKNTFESTANNITSSIKIFELIKKKKTPIIFASSASVYGEKSGDDEGQSQLNPVSPYAYDKLYLERISKIYFDNYQIPSIGFRLFNVYGHNQRSDSEYSGVISKFADQISKNKTPYIFGGSQTRDFVFIDDVCKVFYEAYNYLKKNKNFNDVFNLGTGKSIKIKKLAPLMSKIMKKKNKVKFKPRRKGDPLNSKAKNTKLKKILHKNFNFISVKDGISKFLHKNYDY